MTTTYEQKTAAQIEAEQVELFWKHEAEAEASMIRDANRERKFDRIATIVPMGGVLVLMSVILGRVLFS